jgi:hypothetical protein
VTTRPIAVAGGAARVRVGFDNHTNKVQGMNASEGLGLLGWLGLGLLALMAVVALTTGFGNLIYFALALVPVVFVVMFMLCGGKVDTAS